MSSRKQKRYGEAFRREAVELVAKGRSVAQVAEELGVSAFSVTVQARYCRVREAVKSDGS